MAQREDVSKMSSSTLKNKRAIDDPLEKPGSDLLEMNQHAKALADYIKQDRKLPFTVGIFGEWGEGKTTMVNFVREHLRPATVDGKEPPFYFVTFSAWPYTTSEKLWRALIIEIAKVVYGLKSTETPETEQAEPPEPPPEKPKSKPDVMSMLTGFLNSELFKPKEEQEPTPFDELKRDLDRSDYGKISKRTPAAVDQEAVMSAIVNAALSVLGTVSPLAAGIRSFLPWESKTNAEQSAEVEDETSAEELEALPRFREIYRKMLKKAGDDRVYVFIDDLDRAQPDVALDIMESIRIALSAENCVYILAVDERLIEQGLRLRYRELFAKETDEAINSKGQEYLEKIIQFRTRVPPRTAEQTQRLIAAEFPHWTPAGDIIQTIIGNNPRRVKQYCQRLTFQNMIDAPTFRIGSTAELENAAPHAAGSGQERESNVSEILALSRKLRSSDFNEFDVQDLFMQLSEDPTKYDGATAFQQMNGLFRKYESEGQLEKVRAAIETLKPGLLSGNKRPGGNQLPGA